MGANDLRKTDAKDLAKTGNANLFEFGAAFFNIWLICMGGALSVCTWFVSTLIPGWYEGKQIMWLACCAVAAVFAGAYGAWRRERIKLIDHELNAPRLIGTIKACSVFSYPSGDNHAVCCVEIRLDNLGSHTSIPVEGWVLEVVLDGEVIHGTPRHWHREILTPGEALTCFPSQGFDLFRSAESGIAKRDHRRGWVSFMAETSLIDSLLDPGVTWRIKASDTDGTEFVFVRQFEHEAVPKPENNLASHVLWQPFEGDFGSIW